MMSENKTIDEYLVQLEHFCAYQERCVHDVKLKMQRLQIEPNFQEQIIERLIEQEFIDEKRYAISFMRSKVNLKKDGIQKMAYALRNKRIPDDIVTQAIAEIDREIYLANISGLIEKKWKTLSPKNEYAVAKRKLIAFLMGKGYRYDEFKGYLNALKG